jgi:hypothetical protein
MSNIYYDDTEPIVTFDGQFLEDEEKRIISYQIHFEVDLANEHKKTKKRTWDCMKELETNLTNISHDETIEDALHKLLSAYKEKRLEKKKKSS